MARELKGLGDALFDELDDDGGGTLDVPELKAALKKLCTAAERAAGKLATLKQEILRCVSDAVESNAMQKRRRRQTGLQVIPWSPKKMKRYHYLQLLAENSRVHWMHLSWHIRS